MLTLVMVNPPENTQKWASQQDSLLLVLLPEYNHFSLNWVQKSHNTFKRNVTIFLTNIMMDNIKFILKSSLSSGKDRHSFISRSSKIIPSQRKTKGQKILPQQPLTFSTPSWVWELASGFDHKQGLQTEKKTLVHGSKKETQEARSRSIPHPVLKTYHVNTNWFGILSKDLYHSSWLISLHKNRISLGFGTSKC